jgi:Ca-activated chloride channel family protein
MECDLWAQDCPAGEKCMPWANDGGNSWNATKCTPVDPDPANTGEPCEAEGSGVSGVDDCEEGAMCWDVDTNTNEGHCVSLCTGSPDDPSCEDPTELCTVYNDGVLPLCTAMCDPLVQDCPYEDVCIGALQADGFTCAPDASGDEGQYGDPCEYINVCDPGLFCTNADNVPGCGASIGCCSEFCDVSNPDADMTCSGFDDGQQCVPWFEEGEAPPGFDDVGACSLPDGGAAADSAEDRDEAKPMCPDVREPVVLYMSNDDSNSQASPVLARRRIRAGNVVHPEDVRIYEFLNYYDLTCGGPVDVPAKVGIQMRQTSSELGEFIMLLFADGRTVEPEERPPFNLVFSLDTSGSMAGEPIELLKDSMTELAGSLRAGDTISMVTWSSSQDLVLDGLRVYGPNDPALIDAIERLSAHGSTDLHGGLVRAYETANAHRIQGGINRVVLVSDGGANTGITDIDLIAKEAEDENGEGIYLVGVGVGEATDYNDELMDAVTDAGKGAYIFIDEPAEATRMFGERFLANVAVSARDVRMQVTLPWYFGIKSFAGEEYSPDPAKVDPQHLAPNDTMLFHQTIAACDPTEVDVHDEIVARVDYKHPLTRHAMSEAVTMRISHLVGSNAARLYKGDVVVGYAEALIVIGDLVHRSRGRDATTVARNMVEWVQQAADALQDEELADIADILDEYGDNLARKYGS